VPIQNIHELLRGNLDSAVELTFTRAAEFKVSCLRHGRYEYASARLKTELCEDSNHPSPSHHFFHDPCANADLKTRLEMRDLSPSAVEGGRCVLGGGLVVSDGGRSVVTVIGTAASTATAALQEEDVFVTF